VRDSFLRDRWLGATERVSVSSSGVQGDSHSDGCVVSHDGRYAFFNSMATNLAQANGFASWQTYRHDRRTGLTECVSVNSSGIAGNGGGDFDPVISADGRYVAFDTTSTNLDSCHAFFWNVFLHDCALGTTERISIGPAGHPVRGNSFKPSISETGRYVSFFSYSRAIAPPDTNEVPDVFVWDRGF
jgi:hypothetical protein